MIRDLFAHTDVDGDTLDVSRIERDQNSGVTFGVKGAGSGRIRYATFLTDDQAVALLRVLADELGYEVLRRGGAVTTDPP